jgi:uncharacterized protein YdiU (UPF0061 family)
VKNVTADDRSSYVFWITEEEFDEIYDKILKFLKLKEEDFLDLFPEFYRDKNLIRTQARAYVGASLNLLRFQLIEHMYNNITVKEYDERVIDKIFSHVPNPQKIKFKILVSDVVALGYSREYAEQLRIVLNMNRERMIKLLIFQTLVGKVPGVARKIDDFDKTFEIIDKKIKLGGGVDGKKKRDKSV